MHVALPCPIFFIIVLCFYRNLIKAEKHLLLAMSWESVMSYQSIQSQGWRPYPFCCMKRQSDVWGVWVGKNIFIMTFCVTKWFKRKPHFKRKDINKKYCNVCISVFCFITVLVSCTQRVFKFQSRNQSMEKGSHFTLL